MQTGETTGWGTAATAGLMSCSTAGETLPVRRLDMAALRPLEPLRLALAAPRLATPRHAPGKSIGAIRLEPSRLARVFVK